jgi:hypothetical protein
MSKIYFKLPEIRRGKKEALFLSVTFILSHLLHLINIYAGNGKRVAVKDIIILDCLFFPPELLLYHKLKSNFNNFFKFFKYSFFSPFSAALLT